MESHNRRARIFNNKKRNFGTFDNIVEKRKLKIKHEYFLDMFQAQKTDLKKSCGILNEALNRKKNRFAK